MMSDQWQMASDASQIASGERRAASSEDGSSSPPATGHWSLLKKTLVVGLGKTGVSCVRYLRARGVRVAVTDTRLAPPGLDQVQGE
jgi:NADPH-dependent glutamate synthase beta subunit-like oxidoreductase